MQAGKDAETAVPEGRIRGDLLGVISFAEVGVEHLLSTGLLAAGCGLGRDEYGTDFLHQGWVFHSQHPSSWRFGIYVQQAQTTGRIFRSFRHRPHLESTFRIEYPIFIQVERIESERFAFG